MRQKKEDSLGQWIWFVIGVVFSYLGAKKILTGEPSFYRGDVEIPAWTGWVQLPFGLLLFYFSLRSIWLNRNIPDPPVNIDEEAARAEAEMDAMYLREYGKLPDKPKKDT